MWVALFSPLSAFAAAVPETFQGRIDGRLHINTERLSFDSWDEAKGEVGAKVAGGIPIVVQAFAGNDRAVMFSVPLDC